MKQLTIFLSVIYIISTPIYAQPPDTIWTRSIGDAGDQSAFSVIQTEDSGFILGGYTSGTGTRDVFMVKTDENGNVLWTKSFGDSDRNESANQMIKTNDGGYILAGYRGQDLPYSSNSDIFLVKTDENGNELWSSIIGYDSISEEAKSIFQTSEGGYILCGSYWATSQTGYDILIIKVSNLGLVEWRKSINLGESSADHASSIIQADDGGYLITGKTQAYSTNYDYDSYILKTNSAGEIIWLNTYGNNWPWYEQTYHIIKTSDNGFFICGNQDNEGIDKNWFVVKTDWDGNQLWSNNIVGGTYHEGAFYSCEMADGSYAVAGNYYQDVWKAFITKYNIYGDTAWTKMWGTGDDNSQYNYAIQQLEDGGFITVGSTTTANDGLNIYLSRLSAETVGIQKTEEKNDLLFNIYPNPCKSNINIQYTLPVSAKVNITVYNIFGQKVEEIENSLKTPDRYNDKYVLHNYSKGLYYIRFSTDDEALTEKLLIR